MDTSKEYITMCKQAHEVQAMRVPIWGFCKFDIGDHFSEKDDIFIYANTIGDQPRIGGITWLPKQDQLQELFTPHLQKVSALIDAMKVWDANHTHSCETLEQLWLSMVMHRHFKKGWDEKNSVWIPYN